MAAIHVCFSSCGCNRTAHCVDWGRNGLVCYGACRAVALYQPQQSEGPGGIVANLVAHEDRVNCVKWISMQDGGDETELVSGSSDRTAIVWQGTGTKFQPVAILEGHTGPVTALDALYCHNMEPGLCTTLIATASSDSTVRIWQREEGGFQYQQSISFGSGFAVDVSLAVLPGTTVPVLACGADDHKIHLFVLQHGQFQRSQSLPGHEDWVRGVEFTHNDEGVLLLASCSQDCFIRLWKITPRCEEEVVQDYTQMALQDKIRLKENTFKVVHQDTVLHYAVILESVLQGHENWIYSVHWHPAVFTDGKRHQPLSLLSASMDKSMILWTCDLNSGIWIEQVRVGGVGGNTLGFYGCQFSPSGDTILAHGYQGALHLWYREGKTGDSWQPWVTPSGHFDGVQDIAWDPEDGHFLLTTSTDQTTRLFAPWVQGNREVTWHEVARPQVHGYDLQCLAMVNKFKFASGADEKVTRVFQAPRNFIENLGKITGRNYIQGLKDKETSVIPEGASVPALGLSNKAVYEVNTQSLYEDSQLQPHANEQYAEVYFKPFLMNKPPTEENLLQNTLWPETHKLYGHGYEIFALACNPQGTILASSCKAAKAEHAAVILWQISTWKQLCSLQSHSLTVTQMAFSNSGQYLLTVSRDRTWSLYRQQDGGQDPAFHQVAATNKKTSIHTRIIWSCGWSHDDEFFATSSRDKKVIVWGRTGDGYGALSPPLELAEPVTAVAFAPILVSENQYLLACGLETGSIHLYKWQPGDQDSCWTPAAVLGNDIAHHLTVKKLQFRGRPGLAHESDVKDNILQLASGGSDHFVKIYNIYIDKLR